MIGSMKSLGFAPRMDATALSWRTTFSSSLELQCRSLDWYGNLKLSLRPDSSFGPCSKIGCGLLVVWRLEDGHITIAAALVISFRSLRITSCSAALLPRKYVNPLRLCNLRPLLLPCHFHLVLVDGYNKMQDQARQPPCAYGGGIYCLEYMERTK